jgi:DNA-directed RNA polymerase sigma subunit (sigma70/sigma32)
VKLHSENEGMTSNAQMTGSGKTLVKALRLLEAIAHRPEGLTLAEIGQVLGVTESRVCQIHTKAVLQLRSKMTEPERELA